MFLSRLTRASPSSPLTCSLMLCAAPSATSRALSLTVSPTSATSFLSSWSEGGAGDFSLPFVCLRASSSSVEGLIASPACLETSDKVKAVSRSTSLPTVLRSDRKTRKSALVRSREPTVCKLLYVATASARTFALAARCSICATSTSRRALVRYQIKS